MAPEEVARAKALADASVAPHRSTPKLGNLQALRAIAVLLVLAAHVGGPNGLEERYLDGEPIFGWIFKPAQTAVDAFFVISGLIMTITTWHVARGREAARRFLIRRLKRIYPIYWVPTTLVLILFLTRPDMVNSSSPHPPQVLQSFLLAPQPGLPLLSVGWTLMFEMYFYAIFGAALLAPRTWLPWVLAGWGVLTVVLAYLSGASTEPVLTLIANPLLVEFLLGVVVGYVVMTRPPIAPGRTLVTGLALLAVATFFAPTMPNGILEGPFRAVAIAPPAALIVLGAVGLERQERYVAPRFLQYLGDASYSIYLWHTLLLVAAGRAIVALVPDSNGLHLLLAIAVPVAVVASTLVLYELIERPLLRALSRPRTGSATRETTA